MYFALLGLAALGLLGSLFSSSDDDDGASDTDLTLTPPEPDEPEPQDLGATVTEAEDGTFDIELGEDETGSLVLFRYSDSEDAGIGLSESFSYELYLLPENGSIPEFSYEGPDDPRLTGSEELADLVEALDLQPIASWDLGEIVPTNDEPYFEDNTVAAPELRSDSPIAIYDVEATTDGDEIIYLRPDGYVPPPPTFLGAEQEDVFADVTGNDDTDWFVGQVAGVMIDGAGDSDRLEARFENTTLRGGEGDDDLNVDFGAADSRVEGGSGNDDIDLYASSAAFGDEGDDSINFSGDGVVVEARGGDGNDRIYGSGPGSTLYGDADDDFLGIADGVTGFGGAGDDHLQVESGGIGHGDAGDDLIVAYNFLNDEDGAATVSGGEGSDLFRLGIRNPFGTGQIDYMTITDFDPSEDVLELSMFSSTGYAIDEVTIVEADDGSGSDVLVDFTHTGGLDTATAVVQLPGVTGLMANQIVLA